MVGSTLGELDHLAKIAVPFPVEMLAPCRAIEDKAARDTTMHIGVRMAQGAGAQIAGLRRQFVQFERWQIQYCVGDAETIVRSWSNGGRWLLSGHRSRWSFLSQWWLTRRLCTTKTGQPFSSVSGVHTMMADGIVSNRCLSALRQSEQWATDHSQSGCFEHQVDQVGKNSFWVLVLHKQYRKEVDGSIDSSPVGAWKRHWC